MSDRTEQQTRRRTPEEDIRELFSRVAKLNDITSALLAPAWGSEVGLLPIDHPLYVCERPADTDGEQGAPVDWQVIAKQRERELKQAGEARRHAERQRDEARQWARHGYEIGQRHCGWSDHGVAPDWLTEGWPRHFDSCEHLQQMAQFDEALTRVRALAERWRYTGDRKGGPLSELQAALDGPSKPTHDTGPSVAEAAANDRTYWSTKYAGEEP